MSETEPTTTPPADTTETVKPEAPKRAKKPAPTATSEEPGEVAFAPLSGAVQVNY
ncbi:hypothetical protein AncyloWKF20_07540 [Ancylobacter sp. WKF20]|uniref:hypothetical protein n=1 Tax=Ancylobacter sp. WKF20 TaxID=3039801 RepID=UPI0024344ACF|nr:hypothetical protein [Ancylobacter sp. WKF20]WGD31662.1 hypothetical protein AncyloWKF20_07540 [Ancylobacter sp. WKF20]